MVLDSRHRWGPPRYQARLDGALHAVGAKFDAFELVESPDARRKGFTYLLAKAPLRRTMDDGRGMARRPASLFRTKKESSMSRSRPALLGAILILFMVEVPALAKKRVKELEAALSHCHEQLRDSKADTRAAKGESEAASLKTANAQSELSQCTEEQRDLIHRERELIDSLNSCVNERQELRELANAGRKNNPPPSEQILNGQIMRNLQTAQTKSPYSDDKTGWQDGSVWRSSHRSFALYAVLEITPSLIEVAIRYLTAADSDDEVDAIMSDVKKRLIRQGERTFLLALKPVISTDYPAEWGLKVGDIKTNIKLVSLSGKEGHVTDADRCGLEEMLHEADKPKPCLFFVRDVVDSTDARFTLSIADVTHWIQLNNDEWVPAKEPNTLLLRFEPTDLKILTLLERGMSFQEVEAKYIAPSIRKAQAQSDFRDSINSLIDIVKDVFVILVGNKIGHLITKRGS